MSTPCTEAPTARLDRLERENARMKQFGVLLLVGTATLMVVGTDLFRTRRQVEAREFVLKNREGRVRATLGLKEDGAPRLTLFDSRGRQQVALQSMPDDSSALDFFDRGDVRLHVATGADGSASLQLLNPWQAGASSMFIAPDGRAGVGIRQGLRGALMSLETDGSTRVSFTDDQGREVGAVGVNSDGKPELLAIDSEGERPSPADPLLRPGPEIPASPGPAIRLRKPLPMPVETSGRSSGHRLTALPWERSLSYR